MREKCLRFGLLVRAIRDTIVMSPPLIGTHAEIDRLVDIVDGSLSNAQSEPRSLQSAVYTETRALIACGARRRPMHPSKCFPCCCILTYMRSCHDGSHGEIDFRAHRIDSRAGQNTKGQTNSSAGALSQLFLVVVQDLTVESPIDGRFDAFTGSQNGRYLNHLVDHRLIKKLQTHWMRLQSRSRSARSIGSSIRISAISSTRLIRDGYNDLWPIVFGISVS